MDKPPRPSRSLPPTLSYARPDWVRAEGQRRARRYQRRATFQLIGIAVGVYLLVAVGCTALVMAKLDVPWYQAFVAGLVMAFFFVGIAYLRLGMTYGPNRK